MRHLLVAVDGSECSVRAARLAAELASQLGAKVTLATAVPPAPPLGEPAMVDLAQLDQAQRDAARALLEHTAQALANLGTQASLEVLHGHAPTALNLAADRLGADLLVVGSRGRSALTRAILGSVAHELIQLSKKPVLVVH